MNSRLTDDLEGIKGARAWLAEHNAHSPDDMRNNRRYEDCTLPPLWQLVRDVFGEGSAHDWEKERVYREQLFQEFGGILVFDVSRLYRYGNENILDKADRYIHELESTGMSDGWPLNLVDTVNALMVIEERLLIEATPRLELPLLIGAVDALNETCLEDAIKREQKQVA
jgi:hypothetical protein